MADRGARHNSNANLLKRKMEEEYLDDIIPIKNKSLSDSDTDFNPSGKKRKKNLQKKKKLTRD